MQDLHIQDTKVTPKMTCTSSGVIELIGRSIPENANEVYDPVLDWVDNYCNNPAQKTRVKFCMDYINSISQKMIFALLYRLDTFMKEGNDVEVTWEFEEGDDEILDEGKIFDQKFGLKFYFVELDESE